jgi:hypothetical protein
MLAIPLQRLALLALLALVPAGAYLLDRGDPVSLALSAASVGVIAYSLHRMLGPSDAGLADDAVADGH